MTDIEKKSKSWPLRFSVRTLLVLVTLLSAYLGGYFALLDPMVVVNEHMHGLIVSGCREPEYRFGGRLARVFFSPVAVLDRTLRPDYWVHITDLTRWQDDFPTEEPAPNEIEEGPDKTFVSTVKTSPDGAEGDDDIHATDATGFLKAEFAALQLGPTKLESFRDGFESLTDVTPPDEWCYTLALDAFVYRNPKPVHAGQSRKRIDEFEKMLLSEGRSIMQRRSPACLELDYVPHTHTRAGESRRLTRDAVGRFLIDVGEHQYGIPEHALDRVPVFGCCVTVSKLDERLVVGQHDQIGSGFPIACVDDDTQSVLWKSRVSAMPTKLVVISGAWVHNVQFVQTQSRVAVFGIVNGSCYAELFDSETGEQLLRFCPSRND